MIEEEKEAFAAGYEAGQWSERFLIDIRVRGWAARAHALATHFSKFIASTALGDLEALADEMQATITKQEDSNGREGNPVPRSSSEAP